MSYHLLALICLLFCVCRHGVLPMEKGMDELDGLDRDTQQEVDERKRIKSIIYRFLTRREYSYFELEQKLTYKGFSKQVFGPLLEQFTQQGLQSDQRFAEAFCRFRSRKGYGPFKIEAELRLKGVSDKIIGQTLDSVELDWYKTAKEIIERRFGVDKTLDTTVRSRKWRFLQNRGFTAEQIKAAVE